MKTVNSEKLAVVSKFNRFFFVSSCLCAIYIFMGSNSLLAADKNKDYPKSVLVEVSDTELQEVLKISLPKTALAPSDPVGKASSEDLNSHVSQMIGKWPLSPLFTMTGGGNVFSFWTPRELFYSLSMALPYLKPELRKKVLELLDAEIAKNSPISGTRYEMEGNLRHSQSVKECFTPEKYKDYKTQDWEGLYALWAYCNYGDRKDYAVKNWQAIKSVCDASLSSHNEFLNKYEWQNFDNPQWYRNASVGRLPADLNLRISSLVGFIRLTEMAGKKTDAEKALPILKSMLAKRAGLVVKLSTYYLPFGGEPVQWYEMIPELAIFLDKKSGAQINDFFSSTEASTKRTINSFARNNFWFLTRGEGQMFAENSLNWPEPVLALFKIRCFVYKDDAKTLYRYSDMPWCPGDLSYIEKLTLTLWVAEGRKLAQ